ncbi:hypothetical protein [Asaia bogorensis]|uniref:hypothetical protein n=1 Tax=Asaia bogorensis TaxID=91915 RepID=UPI000AD15391|nr:hypothetical protein [Asaia bogorensis]
MNIAVLAAVAYAASIHPQSHLVSPATTEFVSVNSQFSNLSGNIVPDRIDGAKLEAVAYERPAPVQSCSYCSDALASLGERGSVFYCITHKILTC